MKLLLAAMIGSLSLTACANANAQAVHTKHAAHGQWVLNPNKCPDLVEDRRQRRAMRRDEAVDHSRRDVAEDWKERKNARRDEAVTNCPTSAWEWHGPHNRRNYRPARPIKANIFYHPEKRIYYRKNGHKKVTIQF